MTAPLFESWNPVTQRATEVTEDDDVGLIFVHSQNTRPIVESAKALASNFDPHQRNRDDVVHVARIPIGIYMQLRRLGITQDRKAFDAWLDARDNSVFRTDDRRKL